MNRNEQLDLLLRLLSKATPYKYEREFIEPFLPKGGAWDLKDNYTLSIGNSESLFACHIDTVGGTIFDVNPIIKNDIITVGNKEARCLGGDDRCGILCLLAMIKANIPGTYIFHSGEECGGIGSQYILDNIDLTRFKRAIEFDRMDKHAVIAAMGFGIRCASDEFALELADRLGEGFEPDYTGLFTDTFVYKDKIPECVNLSVGYFNAHSKSESIDAAWLIDVLIPKIISIDWETLPVFRNDLDKEECVFDRVEQCFTDGYGKTWSLCDRCGEPLDGLGKAQSIFDNLCDACYTRVSNELKIIIPNL